MSVILIVGLPHGGTTILRKIIGNIPKVMDHIEELDAIMGIDVNRYLNKIANTDYEAIVVKSPFTPVNLTTMKHPKLKIVFIIKNPYDIYGSYAIRFKDENHYMGPYADRYGISKYEYLVSMWLNLRNDPDIFTVKYEELFDNDYGKVKELIAWLGFTWNDDIIYSKRIAGHQHVLPGQNRPMENTGANNAPYRYYQINQEFRDMTGESKSMIFPTTKARLDSMEILKVLGYDKYS